MLLYLVDALSAPPYTMMEAVSCTFFNGIPDSSGGYALVSRGNVEQL